MKNIESTFPIDIVIPWVDGSDPEWIKEYNKYIVTEEKIKIDSSSNRYRDYGLLKYWFRGIEKFAPWVRTVHFVTCGQKPDWLNLNNPKLHWIKHSDYIPSEYLPVFSSHPIELMMHKIPGLAEHFIYFNDDLFLIAPVDESFYFRKGLPCDSAALNIIPCSDIMGHIVLNDLDEINKYFSTRSVVSTNFSKWITPKNGLLNLRTLFLLPWSRFSGFYDPHFAQPYTKSVLEEVWENCSSILNNTMKSRFRSMSDVNQWLFRYWQLCKGHFFPSSVKSKQFFSLTDDIDTIVNVISTHKYSEIVLNDAQCNDYDKKIKQIILAFDSILPERSCFEI